VVRRHWPLFVSAMIVLAVVVVGVIWVYGSIRDFNGRRTVPDEQIEKLDRHRAVLAAEGDRMLAEAGAPAGGSSQDCDFDPSHRPPTYLTRDAVGELKGALEDLRVTERYASYCTAVFAIKGSTGFGADNPNALLYRGTELYSIDASCEGSMGATNSAAFMAPGWYTGYSLHC